MQPSQPLQPLQAAQAVAEDHTAGALLAHLLRARQTVLPRRLGAPGPDASTLDSILAAAAHAPDHGRLLPWRFILVPQAARAALGKAFAQALIERDPQASPEEQAQACDKAGRAPVVLLLVIDESGNGEAGIPAAERVLSAGCAVQNVLLMATALGYGSALTSGKAMDSRALRQLFALAEGERALCFVNIGSVLSRKEARERPQPHHYVTTLAVGEGLPMATGWMKNPRMAL